MSTFNFVNGPRHKCEGCSKIMTKWQTNEGEGYHETLEAIEVNHYHGTCTKCSKYASYRRSQEGFVLVS